MPQFVMNAFEPSTIHSPSSNRAVVRTSAASEPAPGSVSANPPSASPRASGASQRSFCSSVPNRCDQVAGQPERRRQRDRDRLVDPPELLDREAHRDRVGVGPAVLLGERQPEQPELAHLLHDVEREASPPGRPRPTAARRPRPRTRGRRRGTPPAPASDRSSCRPEPLDVQDRAGPLRRDDRVDALADLHGPSPSRRCSSTVSAPSSFTRPIVTGSSSGSPSMPT